MEIIREFAGKERLFALSFGGVLDLEQARNGDGIGAIYRRFIAGTYSVSDVFHIMRLALIGGGMGAVEVKTLMRDHFDTRPYFENVGIAGEILTSLMVGVEPSDEKASGSDPVAVKFSEVSQICQTFHMSPLDLRAMRYADFVNLVRGFNAASSKQAEFLTEEEFDAILAKYEPEALNGTDG